MISIQKIQGEKWISNCYIIHNESQAIIIDPGSNYDLIKNQLGKLQLKAILATHGHYDHIINVSALKKEYNAPFYIHAGDAKLVKQANLYLKIFHGEHFIEIPKVDHFIEDNTEPDFNFVKLKVIHTPGHTDGSVCYLFDDNLFTGDLLLKSKTGRTDLPGGSIEKIKLSIKKIETSVSGVIILPGHGNNSTLNDERKNNPSFIKILNS